MTVLTAVTSLNASETRTSLEKKSKKENRRVTDGWGFVVFLVTICCTFGHQLMPSIGFFNEVNNYHNASIMVDESWENKSCIGAEAISRVFSFINSSIHASDHDTTKYAYDSEQSSESYLRLLVSILDTAVGWLSVPCVVFGTLGLWFSCFELDYNMHLLIVTYSKLFISAIFPFGWIVWTHRDDIAFFTPLAELYVLLICLGVCVHRVFTDSSKNNNERECVCRSYSASRYLMIFQLFNFAAMALVMAWPAIIVKYFCVKNADGRILLGNVFLICLMHEYGKMVTTLATASQKDRGGGWVSVKTIWSSMITISRYHFGTVVLHAPLIRYMTILIVTNTLGVHEIFTRLATTKHSNILTAIYGHDIDMAVKGAFYFGVKKRFTNIHKSKLSQVWSDMLNISLSLMVLVAYFGGPAVSNVNSLSKYVIVLVYLAALGVYYYVVIAVVKTVEETVTFCRMVNDEDFETIQDKQKLKAVIKEYEDIQENGIHATGFFTKGNCL